MIPRPPRKSCEEGRFICKISICDDDLFIKIPKLRLICTPLNWRWLRLGPTTFDHGDIIQIVLSAKCPQILAANRPNPETKLIVRKGATRREYVGSCQGPRSFLYSLGCQEPVVGDHVELAIALGVRRNRVSNRDTHYQNWGAKLRYKPLDERMARDICFSRGPFR